jgi:hypothetical protein
MNNGTDHCPGHDDGRRHAAMCSIHLEPPGPCDCEPVNV